MLLLGARTKRDGLERKEKGKMREKPHLLFPTPQKDHDSKRHRASPVRDWPENPFATGFYFRSIYSHWRVYSFRSALVYFVDSIGPLFKILALSLLNP